jgi:hypothetical protein
MSRIAIAILAAVALAGSALSIAADRPAGGVKTSSFVPRHSNRHVYGTPIQKPIVGRARIIHHKPVPKKRSSI